MIMAFAVCQIEVFHLKQRLQILEGRTGTPTKQTQ